MIALAPLLAVALAVTPPATPKAVVRQGETLEQVAQRTLGDAGAASELEALNGLKDDHVAPGTRITLPGPDRSLALSALVSAKNAVAAAPPGESRDRAAEKVAQADRLFHRARYRDAADAADAAWALLDTSGAPTRFEVQVADDGSTHVHARTGQMIRVKDPDGLIALAPGDEAEVTKGAPPRKVRVPSAPKLERPKPHARLTFEHGKRLGPVRLSWKPVAGAVRYEVEVLPATGDGLHLKVKTAGATLPPLPPGTYTWSVRAVGETGESATSPSRRFELALTKMRLDAQRTKWK